MFSTEFVEKTVKISYKKHYDKNGYIYDQTISMPLDIFSRLASNIYSERALNFPREKEYSFTSEYAEMYLKPLRKENEACFLNSTQRRFIDLFLKLDLKDRNTRISIGD